MAMNVGSSSEEGDVMVDINTTPLIDVMLVLLIMFIITIPIQTHAVKMNMPVPNPNSAPPKPPEIIRIDVDFDGTVSWNGEAIGIDKRNEIEARLQAVAAIPDQPEVHLRPNKLVTYRHVAMIMATAQRLGVTLGANGSGRDPHDPDMSRDRALVELVDPGADGEDQPQVGIGLREIRRRTRVVGAFPDGESALNLAAARLRHIAGSEWSTKRYLSMEFLQGQQALPTTA